MISQEHENMLVDIAETMRSRHYGKYRAVVVDVDDPKKMGRITVNVPEVLQETETPWALPAAPFAGPDHGLVLIPEVGDGVWIEFEAGDISRPIWSGGWWDEGEMPAPADTQVRVLVTKTKQKIVLDDKEKEIQLLQSNGAEIKMTDDDVTVTIGQSEVKMSSDGITLKNGSTEIKLTSSELTLKGGSGQVKLSASGVDVNNGAMKVL
jgi:uncharacterized protein involved in type VI secretion and phage assembly